MMSERLGVCTSEALLTPRSGTTARAMLYPVKGDIQEALTSFQQFSSGSPSRPDPGVRRGACHGRHWPCGCLSRQAGPLSKPLFGRSWFSRSWLCLQKSNQFGLSKNTEIAVSVLPILFAAVAFGPLAAMVVGAVGLLADFGAPYTRWVIWTRCARSLRAWPAGRRWLVLGESTSFGVLAAAVLAATVTEAIVDAFLASLTVAVRGSGSCTDFLRLARPVVFSSVSFYTPALVLLVYHTARFRPGVSFSFSALPLRPIRFTASIASSRRPQTNSQM